MPLKIKRVYDEAEPGDGFRVLVDRIWPRGVSKERAAVDLWLKEAAPSTELRKWFGHDPEKFEEFKKRYRAELDAKPGVLDPITSRLGAGEVVTLVYSARDAERNQAVVLEWVIGL
ncbi:MAG: DUF488 family protein [Planctomycetota bacterium]